MTAQHLNFRTLTKLLAISIFIFVIFGPLAQYANAAVGINQTINFQGKVVNKTAGTNVADTTYDFMFRIYDAASAGSLLWTEKFDAAHSNPLTVTSGIFRAPLGSVCPFSGGSCQSVTNTAIDFNSDSLYLDITFNGETMGSRIQLNAVPYAFNALKVAGLTVTNNGGNTLNIAANKTLTVNENLTLAGATGKTLTLTDSLTSNTNSLTLAGGEVITFTASNALTLATTGSTSVTLPASGTLITNTSSANQTITSTQSTGTVLGITDSTALTGAIKGLVITLSGANAQDQTGLEFNLSNATGTNLNDIVGTGSTWKVSKAGALTVASCSGCGGASGSNWFANLNGTIYPVDLTNDLLIGGNATSSASFHVYGANSGFQGTLPVASIAAQTSFAALVVDNKGVGDIFTASSSGLNRFVITQNGNVGIGTASPTQSLDVSTAMGNGAIPFLASTVSDTTRGFRVTSGIISTAGYDVGGLWATTAAPTAANAALLADNAGNTYFNAASGQGIYYQIGNANKMQLTTNGGLSLGATYYSTDPGAGNMIIQGSVGVGTTSPLATLDVRGNSGTISVASVSGATSFATLVANNNGVGDLFTASSSSQTRFTVSNVGNVTAGTYNGLTLTTSTGTFSLTNAKTFTVQNTLTLSGTDGSILNIGAGGTLGSNAFTSTAYAPLASPTFTGTVTIPTPFTLGAISVTSTGTQLNYLNAATGTTGTTSQKIVFDTSPTLVTPALGDATATTINKVTLTAPAASATLTISNTKTLTVSDSTTLNTNAITLAGGEVITFSATNALSLLTTGTTSVTLPTSGTLVSSVTTGNGVSATNTAGALAFTLGAITPSTVNGLTLTAAATGFTIAGGTTPKTLTVNNTLALSGTDTNTYTFPSVNSGTVLTTNQTSQTVNSAQASGNMWSLTNTAFNTTGANLSKLSLTNAATSGTVTISGVSLNPAGTATAGTNNINGMDFVAPATPNSNNFYGINFGTGYTDILRYNGSQIISGTGVLQSGGLSGTYSNALTLSSASNAFTGTTYNGLIINTTTGILAVTNAKTLTVSDSTTLNTNSITLAGGEVLTFTASNALTLTTTGTTSVTLPTGGTLLTNTAAANQTITSTQTSGTVLGVTDASGTAASTGLAITLTGSGAVDQTGLSFALSGATGTNLNDIVGSGSTWKVSKAGALTVASCAGCGGGGTNYFNQANGLTYIGNTTTDFAIGGNSTSSAKFVFGTVNAGTPTATFSGDLIINNKPTTAVTDMQTWNQTTGTAGTIGGNNSAIASVSAAVVFNGSLYIGTNKANAAEVYRYNGNGTSWTKVSQTSAGTIASGGTASIDTISSMTVFNGYMYIGTFEPNAAEIYRYDGGTSWTKVSQATAGTIRSAGTASIDGVMSMAVYNGKLWAGTQEGAKAELYRYDGGTTWTIINTTPGTFVATNAVAVDSINAMVSYAGSLYLGTKKTTNGDVLRYNGSTGSVFTQMNGGTSTATYTLADGTAAMTSIDEVTQMTIYENRVIVAVRKAGGAADVLMWNNNGIQTTTDTWLRMSNTAGTIQAGGTSGIDSIGSIAVYNGRLYVGTIETNLAQIYRYENNLGAWTLISQNTAGTIASGGTGSIDGISVLISYNHNSLFAGTLEGTTAEGYSYVSSIDESYKLKFHAGTSQGGGEQSGLQNLGSIFFVASLSANVNNKAGNTGSFVFSHNIMTNNGSYDVAEDYPTRDDTLESGDLISIDPNERGFVKKSEGDYDYSVIGVYSEKPALRLSQDDSQIDGGRAIPVALAGRVPIKVSTENGEIKSGDFLTSSSTSGVAMKAKKSGLIIGQAMDGYSKEGVGEILAYIKSTSYNGSIAQSFADLNPASDTFSKDLLTRLGSVSENSDVVTNRVVAGLEIITPKITVHEISLDSISPATGSDILLNLTPEGKFIVNDENGNPAIVFDSSGNAHFSGTITADKIKANQVEGLEIMTNKISSLDDRYASLSAGLNTQNAIASLEAQIISKASSSSANSPSNSAGWQWSMANGQLSDGLVSGNLRVKGNGLFEGILNVVDTITTNNFIVNGISTFFGDAIFKGKTSFEQTVAFNSDTAGFAIIKRGDRLVIVKFDKEYDSDPAIAASVYVPEITDKLFASYIAQGVCDQKQDSMDDCQQKAENIALQSVFVITKKSTKGFTILLQKDATSDTTFSWTALSVKNAKIFDDSKKTTVSATLTGQ